jgi:hypothetical protein
VLRSAASAAPAKVVANDGARASMRAPAKATTRAAKNVCRKDIKGRLLLKRNDFKLKRHFSLASYLSMIFPENRYSLFRIMLWEVQE